MNKQVWKNFQDAVMGAVAAETVTEQQWRLIARLGYQLLDGGGMTYGQKAEIDHCLKWAESNVDEPTIRMRDNFMKARNPQKVIQRRGTESPCAWRFNA